MTRSLAARLRDARALVATLERAQRDELLRMVGVAYPLGDVFSVVDAWLQPELRTACLDAGIANPQSLGKHLRQWRGHGVSRVGRDERGVLWTCDG